MTVVLLLAVVMIALPFSGFHLGNDEFVFVSQNEFDQELRRIHKHTRVHMQVGLLGQLLEQVLQLALFFPVF